MTLIRRLVSCGRVDGGSGRNIGMITRKFVAEYRFFFLRLLFFSFLFCFFFLCEWRRARRAGEPPPAKALEGKRIVIPRKSLGSSSLMNNELARGLEEWGGGGEGEGAGDWDW